jgi:hypothetical protein
MGAPGLCVKATNCGPMDATSDTPDALRLLPGPGMADDYKSLATFKPTRS